MLKKLILAGVIAVMASSPVLAQNAPPAGAGGGTCAWCGLTVGSNVIIGGVMFVVLAAGLALADGDGSIVIPTPAPTPTPTTTTTTTT